MINILQQLQILLIALQGILGQLPQGAEVPDLVFGNSIQEEQTFGGVLDFTFVQSVASSNQTDLTNALTGVGAGNLIVAWVKWEGASGGTGIASLSDGTSSFATSTLVNNGTDMHGQFAYLLSANGGNKTYTLSINGTETWVEWMIMEFSYTGTVSLDTQNVGSGSGTSLTSGNISLDATADSWLVLGGGSNYFGSNTVSNRTINNAAAEGFVNGYSPYGSLFYDILSSSFANENAQVTLNQSSIWICNIIAFKSVLSAGEAAPAPIPQVIIIE